MIFSVTQLRCHSHRAHHQHLHLPLPPNQLVQLWKCHLNFRGWNVNTVHHRHNFYSRLHNTVDWHPLFLTDCQTRSFLVKVSEGVRVVFPLTNFLLLLSPCLSPTVTFNGVTSSCFENCKHSDDVSAENHAAIIALKRHNISVIPIKIFANRKDGKTDNSNNSNNSKPAAPAVLEPRKPLRRGKKYQPEDEATVVMNSVLEKYVFVSLLCVCVFVLFSTSFVDIILTTCHAHATR